MKDLSVTVGASISGKTINGILFRTDSIEIQCEEECQLRLFSFPKIIFQADDVNEDMGHASLPQKLVSLIGKKIGSARKDAMEDYVIHVQDFATLILGDGMSFSGQTGLMIDGAHARIVF